MEDGDTGSPDQALVVEDIIFQGYDGEGQPGYVTGHSKTGA